MDYKTALYVGKIAFALIVAAPLHYILRVLYTSVSQKISPQAVKFLRSAMMYARTSHPYVGALVPCFALYHIYIMWMNHDIGVKVGFGIAAAFSLLCMAGLGVSLKLHPANSKVRRAHRIGAWLLVSLTAAHRLI